MTDHQGHAKGKPMTDIVDRARRTLSDYEHVKALGVSPCPDMAYRLVADLIAEVERLRAGQDVCATTHVDLSIMADRLIEEHDQAQAALERVRELHRRVNSVTCENCGENTDYCECDCNVEVWMPICEECSPDSDGDPVAHPCATIRSLDGES